MSDKAKPTRKKSTVKARGPGTATQDQLAQALKNGKGGVSRGLLSKEGLTPKQAVYVKGIADGLPGYKAAYLAYNTTDYRTASAVSAENLKKPSVREAVERALDIHAITVVDAVKPIREALDDGELEMRLKGSDRALKLMGAFSYNNEGGNTINFNFGGNKYVKGDQT